MPYTVENFRTKKAFRKAFKLWKDGTTHKVEGIEVFQPGPFGPKVPNGRTVIEGPHLPRPHTWYADVEVLDGKVTKIYGRRTQMR